MERIERTQINMNIKYHLLCGVILDCTVTKFPIGIISSVIPDVPLIANEIRLIKNKQKFNQNDVSNILIQCYFATHSLLILPLLAIAVPHYLAGYALHILTDLFTHTGRFTARPFFPLIDWRFPWGRNILK